MKTLLTGLMAAAALTTTEAAAEVVVMDFDTLPGGSVMSAQYEGVTIRGRRIMGDGAVLANRERAMLFDTSRLTGQDADLVGPFRSEDGLSEYDPGNVLIVSEDGDADDPDDSWSGGRLVFDFDEAVTFLGFNAFDINATESLSVTAFGLGGEVIARFTNEGRTVPDNAYLAFGGLRIEGVGRLAFELSGSGAIDDLMFDTADAVPLPAAGLLFPTGAGGLLARRKRAA